MKNQITLAVALIILSMSGYQVFGNTSVLLAGTAKANITPKEGIIHDSLYIRTVILDVDEARIAVISVDMISFFSQYVKDVAREQYNISHVLFCPSHTHTGARGLRDPDAYRSMVEKKMIGLLDEATRNLFPATISAGHRAFPQLTYNRLIMREDGHKLGMWNGDEHFAALNPERIPYGPVDPEVGVIKIEDMHGETRAVIMNYACHTDIVANSFEASADYPGVASMEVEKAFEKSVCLFVQGAAGNIAPLFISPRRRHAEDSLKADFTQPVKMGKLLSYQVIDLARSLKSDAEEVSMKVMTDNLSFTGRFDKTIEFDVHITTLLINDNIAIATFPGEPFIEFQFDWKKRADVDHPFLFGYVMTGGMFPGYVPDIRSAAQGGYGADTKPNGIEVGAGETIMNKHVENFYNLNGLMRTEPGPREAFEDQWKYLRD